MKPVVCSGLDGSDPLGLLAALGLLRVVSREDPSARLSWREEGPWVALLETQQNDLVDLLMRDVARWREGHGALDFARDADRKVQDLKIPPDGFRALMRRVQMEPEPASFLAAYATGVAVDGSGVQTKPTALHFTAGQQRFLAAVLSVLDTVNEDDLREALFGPWMGRTGPSDTRWRAGSERSRALLWFDPSGEKTATIVGAVWLGYQGMPLFPTAPEGSRVITTGFTGRGNDQMFTWPLWVDSLFLDEIRALLSSGEAQEASSRTREARGIGAVFRSQVVRSSQGYGNFAPARRV